MKLKRPRSRIQWLRRVCQAAFLLLFLWLLLGAHLAEGNVPRRGLKLFFDLDPLVSLATIISTRTLEAGALLALATVVAALLLGRVFCGWICPLGAVHTMASWFRKKPRSGGEAESRSPWHRLKYALLIALLVMALFGVHWIGVFDPIPLLYRSVTTAVLPALQYAIEDSSTAIYQADPQAGSFHLTSITEPAYVFSRDKLFQAERQTFTGATFIALLFIGIVALNLLRPRFWCRYLCPLGGLLGLLAQRPLLRLRNDADKCRNCGRCTMNCPAAAQPGRPGEWLATECFGCWNCVAGCKFNSLSFGFSVPRAPAEKAGLDLSRRTALGAGAGGFAALLSFRLPPQARDAQPYTPTLIRPPGARAERDFVQRCIQCGACMRACPTNALQPTALEAGIEGLWTPKLVPKIGYCLDSCSRCGQVCPTGAIEPLPIEVKRKRKIGLAAVDRNRCLPFAYGRQCIVCEEHCPLTPKAIYLVEREVVLRGGERRVVKEPHVDPDQCTGCGICEWACVFKDRAAIRVTCANEARHPANQPILPSPSGQEASGPYG